MNKKCTDAVVLTVDKHCASSPKWDDDRAVLSSIMKKALSTYRM